MTLKKTVFKLLLSLTCFTPLLATPNLLPIAHRGASAHRPENTLEAFQLAYQMGAKALEFDCWLSRDGEVMVCHDQDLERTTNLIGRINDFDLSDLQKADAGSWFHPSYANAQIPSLQEVLEFSKNKDLTLFVELKDPNLKVAQKTVELLESYEMVNQAYVISFEHDLLTWLHENHPHIHLGISFSKNISEEIISKSLEIDAEGLILPYYKVDVSLIEKIQKQNLKVWFFGGRPNTDDHLTKVKQSLVCGVNGYFTDYPELN